MARSRKKDIIVLPRPRAEYGVALLSHGSPEPRTRLATDLLARRVGHRLNAAVALASLDHDRARLDGAVQQLSAKGVNQIIVVPLLLNVAYHATSDVPEATTQIKISHPGVNIRVARPLGADPTLLKGLDSVIKNAGFRPSERTGVVLASAGSTHESARARHAALALEWRSHGWGGSAVAFVSGPGPRISDAVATLREYDLDRILVVPFVVSPGTMSQRISREARQAGAIAISTTIHSTDAAVDVVVRRIEAALESEPLVSPTHTN
ncbi:MAG: CbiX/SirB N-terminal domain-containing protein [Candidatus Nanopelagicales bacterium]|nr:CbiX/SirB N-terminal domain-containing protein [Candidatus Nanopelagicales bacterium]